MPTNYAAPPQGRVRPSAWWYALVPIIFLAGIGFGVAGAIDEGRAIADSVSTLGADGRGTVELDAGDTATVMAYWEDGRSTESIERPPATVTITDPDGDAIAFDPAGSGESTFSFDSKSGIDLGTFDADVAGTHEVRVEFGQAVPGTSTGTPLAAVGRLDWGSIAGRVGRPIGLGALASVGLLILLIVLRGASKRRRTSSPQFQGQVQSTGGTNPSKGPFV